MYGQDSFFTLSGAGQAGLLALSLALSIAMLWVTFLIPRYRVAFALTAFWLFVWVSPQAYYQYYLLIFDGLPRQWVIWPMRSPLEALELMMFSGPENLSAHGQGLLGWAMVAVAVFTKRPLRRNAAN